MSEIKDGGAAFPVPSTGENFFDPGMSLRDWFAGQAIAGFLAGEVEGTRAENAEAAYKLADAMLKARGT